MRGYVTRLRSSRVHLMSLTCQDLPGFPPIFHTASDKNLEIGKAGYKGYCWDNFTFVEDPLGSVSPRPRP